MNLHIVIFRVWEKSLTDCLSLQSIQTDALNMGLIASNLHEGILQSIYWNLW